MAQRKTRKRRKSDFGARHQSRSGRTSRQGLGELPFMPESAVKAGRSMDRVTGSRDDYSDMIDDIAALTRRNVAATFTLGMAAGLFTAQLARQWTTGMRKR